MKTFKYKHEQLFELLIERFRNGDFPEGTRLPGARQLAEKYEVSINVAVKTLNMLKENGLTTSKPQVGTISLGYTEADDTIHENESEENKAVFLAGRKKTIRLLNEDYFPFQKKFWQKILADFSKANPDIDLVVEYNDAPEKQEYDLLIGGTHFMNLIGKSLDHFVTDEIIRTFDPELYDSAIMTPETLIWKKEKRMFPISFQMPVILHRPSGSLSVNPEENALDMLKRLKTENPDEKLRYRHWSISNFLVNCGCSFVDPESGSYKLNAPESVLKEIRELYVNGDLVDMHGVPLDYSRIFRSMLGDEICFFEHSFNELNSAFDVSYTPWPVSEHFPLIPVNVYISEQSRFPEENVRLIRHLLSEQVQQEMLNQEIALPVRKPVLQKSRFDYLIEAAEKADKIWVTPPDKDLDDAIESILIWEFYYYFTGRNSKNPIPNTNVKINYFLERNGK